MLVGRTDQRLDRFQLLAQRLVLGADFHLLELAQIAQAHVEDGVGLHVGELEGLHQDGLGLVLAADDLDDLVEVEIGDEVAAEHFQAMLDLRQPELGAAHQHLAAVIEPLAQGLGEADHLRDAALHQHVHVERNAAFQLGELEQRFHQQLGIDGARARLDDEAHILGQFVAHVVDQRQLLLVEEFGDLLDQARLLHQPGNFGDDDLIGAAAALFLLPARAHAERAAAGGVGFGDRRRLVDDDAAGREIRALDEFQQRAAARIRVVDQMQRGVAQLGRIVRRDRRRHADRDALRAVGEQIGKGRRQHHRLFAGAVVGRAEIDRVLVDAVDQEARDFGQARFGVAHGGRVIAVDVAEIALPVDQRIALGEILREPHQRVVDRLVAVRMEFADDVADHPGRFLEGGAGIEPQLPHGIEQPPMHGLEAVARIRQRAVHDRGQRIGEIALFERVAQRDLFNLALVRGKSVSCP